MPVGYGKEKTKGKKRNERKLKSPAFSVFYNHKHGECARENDACEESDDDAFIAKQKAQAKHQFDVAASDPAARKHHNGEKQNADRKRADEMFPPKDGRQRIREKGKREKQRAEKEDRKKNRMRNFLDIEIDQGQEKQQRGDRCIGEEKNGKAKL